MIDKYKEYTTHTGKFESQHVMTFEPDSFKKIFTLLSNKGLIKLDLLRVYNTPFLKNEFVSVFQKNE